MLNCFLIMENKGLIMTCYFFFCIFYFYFFEVLKTVPMFRVTRWFISKHNCPCEYKDKLFFFFFSFFYYYCCYFIFSLFCCCINLR